MTSAPQHPDAQSSSIDSHLKMDQPTNARDVNEDRTLEALGYVNPYRRVLKGIGNLSMVISLTSPLSAILITGGYQVTNGGYWGLVWGWIIPSIVFLPQALAAAALASAMPVNGAFYWWTGALAPTSWSRFLSFVSGWTNYLTLVTSIASFAFAIASSSSRAITYLSPSWEPTNAEVMAIAIGLVIFWAALAGLRLEEVSWMYVGCASVVFVHMVVFVIALPTTHALQHLPFASGGQVFSSYSNYSDWSPAVAVPFTWFTAAWVNSAWAAPAYVAEATHDARRSVPRSIVGAYTATAVSGTILCVLMAFCITDMDTLAADPSGFPLITLIYDHWGASATAAFLLVVLIVTGVGGSAVALAYSFQIAAFARDGGLPYASFFSRISARGNMPLNAILMLCFSGGVILIFALSSIASAIIYSLAIMAYLVTYALPNALMLFAGDRWVPGPFNFGRFDKLVFALALASQIYLAVMQSFPPSANWTAETFNYNWVVAVAVIIFSALLYFAIGKRYAGIDVSALATMRKQHLDGVAVSRVETSDNMEQVGGTRSDAKTGADSVMVNME